MKRLFLTLIFTLVFAMPGFCYDTLIDAQTAAVTTSRFVVKPGKTFILVAYGLGASDQIKIQAEVGAGQWVDACDSNGDVAVLSTTSIPFFIEGPGRYRLVKGVTAAAVTVIVNRPGSY